MSMDASGSLNGTIVFSKWKGRNYARTLVRPANPDTPAQKGTRTMMTFLSQAWKNLAETPQASWTAPAKPNNVSGFNQFVSANMKRWRQFTGPQQNFEPTTTNAATTIAGTPTVTGGQRNAAIAGTLTSGTNQWGVIIFRATAAITTPNWNNAVAIVPMSGGTTFSYTDSPLDAGTYHYRFAAFTNDGQIGAASADQTAIVT
jgi:hypothetical protein